MTSATLSVTGYPTPTATLTIKGAINVTGATLSLSPGTGGTVTVAISGLTTAPTTLALGSGTCEAGCTYSTPTGTINYSFINVTATSALLVVYIPPAVTPGGPYSIPISINSNQVGTFS